MTERELLRRMQTLEAEQREHYANGRDVCEAICTPVGEARVRGLCLQNGQPVAARLMESDRKAQGSRPLNRC